MTHLQIAPFLNEPFTLDVKRFLDDLDGDHDLPKVEPLEAIEEHTELDAIDFDMIADVLKKFAA